MHPIKALKTRFWLWFRGPGSVCWNNIWDPYAKVEIRLATAGIASCSSDGLSLEAVIPLGD